MERIKDIIYGALFIFGLLFILFALSYVAEIVEHLVNETNGIISIIAILIISLLVAGSIGEKSDNFWKTVPGVWIIIILAVSIIIYLISKIYVIPL